MSNLRQLILASDDLKTEIVEISEWSTEESVCKIKVQALSGRERAKWLQNAVGEDGKADLQKIYPDLVITCSHDPETNEKIFEPTDRDALNEKSGSALEKIAQVAVRISGLSKEAGDTVAKN